MKTLSTLALFLEEVTAGGLDRGRVLEALHSQYRKPAEATIHERFVLWFDACLFDQSMLVHILTFLHQKGILEVDPGAA